MIDDCLFVAASVDEIKKKIFRRDAFRCNSNFNSPGLVAEANWNKTSLLSSSSWWWGLKWGVMVGYLRTCPSCTAAGAWPTSWIFSASPSPWALSSSVVHMFLQLLLKLFLMGGCLCTHIPPSISSLPVSLFHPPLATHFPSSQFSSTVLPLPLLGQLKVRHPSTSKPPEHYLHPESPCQECEAQTAHYSPPAMQVEQFSNWSINLLMALTPNS